MLSSDIARQIATELRLELTAPQKARLSRVPTVSAAAYDLYLRGLHSLNQNTRDGRAQAIKFFQHAVEIDPSYARAWAGLADAYTRYSNYTEPVLMRTRAREALAHALQLDPQMPEAHVSSGLLYLWDEWNLNAALKEFKRAIELNPNLAVAHEHYSRTLCDDAKFDDALREARIAKQLDPLSRGSSINLAGTLLYAGQNDAALAELVRLRSIAPDYPAVHYLFGRVYQIQGRTEDACAEYIKSDELAGVDSTRIAALKQACQDSGLDGYNREMVRFLLTQDPATNAYEIGGLYIELNEKEKGYEYLEKAYEQRNMGMLLIKADPDFNAIRHEPRFRKLMARVGFDVKGAGSDEALPAQHQ
jgi:tetratricopeptide (TPR) repeat protein